MILTIAIFYNMFMVLFTIALEVDFDHYLFYIIDSIAILIYLVDIFMRANTALTSAREYCLDR